MSLVRSTCLLCFLACAFAPAQTVNSPVRLDKPMLQARGTFQVKMSPRSPVADEINAMTLDKTYTGDLQAMARGEFLSAGDPKSGNAGYVALERINGVLAGRSGSFALMQSGIMAAGAEPKMTVTIVPGSGTGDLSSIEGSMTIVITPGTHTYTLNYAFSKQ